MLYKSISRDLIHQINNFTSVCREKLAHVQPDLTTSWRAGACELRLETFLLAFNFLYSNGLSYKKDSICPVGIGQRRMGIALSILGKTYIRTYGKHDLAPEKRIPC